MKAEFAQPVIDAGLRFVSVNPVGGKDPHSEIVCATAEDLAAADAWIEAEGIATLVRARLAIGAGAIVHHGHCLPFLANLDPLSVDVSIMDPPYEQEAHTKARRSLKDATQRKGAVNTGEVRRIDAPIEIDFAAMTDKLRTGVALELARVTRRWAVAFCQIEGVSAWRAAFEAAGLEWIRGGVWEKPNGAPQFTGDRPGQGFECLAIAHRPGRKRWNGGGRHAVWKAALEHRSNAGGKNVHPTTKPLALMLQLVADFSDPGELVLDPFAGSGTTGVAALRLGRRFLGCELQEKYARLAGSRLAFEEGQRCA